MEVAGTTAEDGYPREEGSCVMLIQNRTTEAKPAWSPTPSRPLDTAVWQAWLAKNRAEEQRVMASRIRVLKVVGLAIVVALALLVVVVTPSRLFNMLATGAALIGMIAVDYGKGEYA